MKIEATGLDGLLLIEPVCYRDARGFFLESFQANRYRDVGIADEFVQDNHSRSTKGVLRGLHFQIKRPQAQIVTVMRGRIFDVVVDIRPGSPTFGQWHSVELSDEGPRQIYAAPGFAHGFCVLSDVVDLHYKIGPLYDRGDEGGLVWNDPDIGVRWPIEAPTMSDRDRDYPRLRDFRPEDFPRVNLRSGT